jgi:hypothetical protein
LIGCMVLASTSYAHRGRSDVIDHDVRVDTAYRDRGSVQSTSIGSRHSLSAPLVMPMPTMMLSEYLTVGRGDADVNASIETARFSMEGLGISGRLSS